MPTHYMTVDGLSNLAKNIGGGRDPMPSTTFVSSSLSVDNLDALYSNGSLVGKIVDIPIDDALQKGRYIDDPSMDEEDKHKFYDTLQQLEYDNKFGNAAKWARLYGGAVILIGIRNQVLTEPLDINTIKVGDLEYLLPLDAGEIRISSANTTDLRKPNFRRPEFYEIGTTKIHYTRVVLFDGVDAPYRIRENNNGFGLSVVSRIYDDIFRAEHSAQSADTLLWNAKDDVLRIPGLMEKVASNSDSSALYARFKLANDMRSNLSLMLLDKDEEFMRYSCSFSGLVDLIRQNLEKLASVADIPVTRLLGRSPGGLNATGESDMGNYHNTLKALQETNFRPKMMTLDTVILKSLGMNTDTYSFKFNPLEEMNALEIADIELKNANRDAIYLDRSVVTPEIVVKQLVEDDTYSAIDDDFIEAVESVTRNSDDTVVTDRVGQTEWETSESMSEGRWRLRNPGQYDRFIRRESTTEGITYIIGIKSSGKNEIQSVQFDKKKWDSNRAKKWMSENKERLMKE